MPAFDLYKKDKVKASVFLFERRKHVRINKILFPASFPFSYAFSLPAKSIVHFVYTG